MQKMICECPIEVLKKKGCQCGFDFQNRTLVDPTYERFSLANDKLEAVYTIMDAAVKYKDIMRFMEYKGHSVFVIVDLEKRLRDNRETIPILDEEGKLIGHLTPVS